MDTIGILWAIVLAAGAGIIGMFYKHGGRLSSVEARIEFLEEATRDNKKWLIKIHDAVTEQQIRQGRRNGKRRRDS